MANPAALDLAPLSTFRKVAETKSFTAAARALRMTVPAVSRQISRLEKGLRVQLIARTTRALRLTEAGELLYAHCDRGLAELEQALELVSSLRGEAHGLLRVVATPCFGRLHIVPAVAEFLAAHPRVAVEISLSHADSSFLGSRADIVVRTIGMRGASIGRERIAAIRHVICATPRYIQQHGAPRRVDELKRHNCFVMTQPEPRDSWPVVRGRQRQRVRVAGNFRADTMDALYQAVMGGAGIARLPTYVIAPELASGALVDLFPATQEEDGGVWMAAFYLKSRYPDLKTQAFLEFLKARFGRDYDWERPRRRR